MKSAFSFCVLLSAAMWAGGCAAYQPPRVAVREIHVTERTAEAVVLNVLLDVENANNVPLELHQFHYTFTGGGRTYSGRWAANATIGPQLSSQLTIPAVLDPDAAAVAAEYGLTGRLSYTAPGFLAQALRDLGFPRPTVGFTERGALPRE